MKKIIKILTAISFSIFPLISFADNKDLKYIAGLIIDYLNIALYLIIGLAVVVFVWNIFRYFFTEKDKKEAGLYVMYSIIGFFIILSFWGIVAIVRNSLKLNDSVPNTVPSTLDWNTYIKNLKPDGLQYSQPGSMYNNNSSNFTPNAPTLFNPSNNPGNSIQY